MKGFACVFIGGFCVSTATDLDFWHTLLLNIGIWLIAEAVNIGLEEARKR